MVDVTGDRAVEHSGASGNFMLRFLDEPLTVIVLTNLDNPSGRHGMLLARSIAGIVRPALRPPHDLAASTDPSPALTATVTALLSDVAARRASAAMSDTYRIWYESAPGSRAWMASQLSGGTPLQYMGRETRSGASVRGQEPIEQLIHYAMDVKAERVYLSIGINSASKVCSVDFYLR
jgi:hypothetical protein